MGRFDTIKTTIDANIKENGNQEITGQKMNSILTEMVNATDAELTELESQVDNLNFDIKSETILGTDTGTWGYSWGFQCDDEYDDLQFLPEFTEPIPYTLDVYQVDGEVGQTGTKYTLINTSSLRAGEACHVANTNKHTLVIVTSSDGTLIKYTEVKPSVCAFDLVYRKEEKFGKVNNSYISGTIVCKTQKKVQSPLFGKNVYLIGDSITEENNGRAETNWVGFLRENCKCNITNKGVSGTGFSTAPRQKYARRIPEVGTDVDIFGITISFNDLDMTLDGIEDPTYKREVGTYMDTSESTICGFINVFFDTLFERFPSVPVITYIQNPWAEGGTQPHHPAYRYGQTKSDDFVAKVTETIRRRGVPVYADMYLNGSVLKPWIEGNKNVYFVGTNGVSDTDHPGTEGHKVIYKYLREKFEQNVA